MNVIFLHVLFQPSSGLACSDIKEFILQQSVTTLYVQTQMMSNSNFICTNTGDVEQQLPFIFLHDRPQNGLYKTGRNMFI